MGSLLVCWGSDDHRQATVGIGMRSNVVSVSAGYKTTCRISNDNVNDASMECFGDELEMN